MSWSWRLCSLLRYPKSTTLDRTRSIFEQKGKNWISRLGFRPYKSGLQLRNLDEPGQGVRLSPLRWCLMNSGHPETSSLADKQCCEKWEVWLPKWSTVLGKEPSDQMNKIFSWERNTLRNLSASNDSMDWFIEFSPARNSWSRVSSCRGRESCT